MICIGGSWDGRLHERSRGLRIGDWLEVIKLEQMPPSPQFDDMSHMAAIEYEVERYFVSGLFFGPADAAPGESEIRFLRHESLRPIEAVRRVFETYHGCAGEEEVGI